MYSLWFRIFSVAAFLCRDFPAWAFSTPLQKRRPNCWMQPLTVISISLSLQQQQQQLLLPPIALLSSSSSTSETTKNGQRRSRNRKPSKVTDEDGPTPDLPHVELDEIDIADIPELREIENESQMPPGPIPHQPWRRGETNGCEDLITADWRIHAEDTMTKAATLVGGKVIDITWYLTQVLVTLDDDLSNARDMLKSTGPVINVKEPGDPLYYDPHDPKPEDIWDLDEIVYERETEEEAIERKEKKKNMYATKDESDPEDEPHIPEGEDDTEDIPLYMNEETREDAAYTEAKEAKERYDEMEKPVTTGSKFIDTAALSTIAGAMMEALEDVEEELLILSRHELVLSSPGPPDVLETQKQFNAHRGENVIVETQDPWQSNRVLKGTLLDRNSMDVLINKKGRCVTIPLNFVKCVRLAEAPVDAPSVVSEEQSEEPEP